MHPAFSVIFFTVASGCGYGLLFVLGIVALLDPHTIGRTQGLLAVAMGALFAAAGLLSSMFHLGQPQRAWRAFTQWRSSWLSREGVAAVCSFIPVLTFGFGLWFGEDASFLRIAGGLLAFFAIVTVGCTARIYTSLKTIHAWHNDRVLPGYWLLALLGGAAWWQLLQRVVDPVATTPYVLLGLLPVAALASFWFKRAYWRFIDTTAHAATPASATGLGSFGRVRAGERPHTEANYLTNEMGFVLARKHAASLRTIAAFLFGIAPLFFGLVAAATDGRSPITALFCIALGTLSVCVGLFVERWLFFAEAKHVVMLYYGADST